MNLGEFFNKMGQSCNDLIEKCRWGGKFRNCTNMFKPSFTYEGHCCSFNFNYIKKDSKKTIFYGPKNGLTVAIKPDESSAYSSTIIGNGLKVLIHKAYAFPSFMTQEIICEAGRENFVEVMTQIKISERLIETLPFDSRQCFLPHEEVLKSFNIYTIQNCVVQCIIDRFEKYCNCLPFYIPNPLNFKVCSPLDMPCFIKNRSYLTISNIL